MNTSELSLFDVSHVLFHADFDYILYELDLLAKKGHTAIRVTPARLGVDGLSLIVPQPSCKGREGVGDVVCNALGVSS